MSRVACYIDGFNMYYAIREDPSLHKYKWLDYSKLVKRFIDPQDEIVRITFFTADPKLIKNDPGQQERHSIYKRALRSVGVIIKLGKYSLRERKCPQGHYYHDFIEKMTDVNIAVYLLEEAMNDIADKYMLFSGDNDLTPAVKAFRRNFDNDNKEIHVIRPIGERGQKADTLCKHANNYHWIYVGHLRDSQFDNPLSLPNGTKLEKPSSWI